LQFAGGDSSFRPGLREIHFLGFAANRDFIRNDRNTLGERGAEAEGICHLAGVVSQNVPQPIESGYLKKGNKSTFITFSTLPEQGQVM